jgi:hypothetical protein
VSLDSPLSSLPRLGRLLALKIRGSCRMYSNGTTYTYFSIIVHVLFIYDLTVTVLRTGFRLHQEGVHPKLKPVRAFPQLA